MDHPAIAPSDVNTGLRIRRYSRRDKPIERERINRSVGINHENVFIERRVHTNYVLDLVINLEFQRVHRGVEVNLGPEIREKRYGCGE